MVPTRPGHWADGVLHDLSPILRDLSPNVNPVAPSISAPVPLTSNGAAALGHSRWR